MKKKNQDKISVEGWKISMFVEDLRAIRDHHIYPSGWEALRLGKYMDGKTESQRIKCGPGGTGMFCPQVADEEWSEAWNAITALHQQERISMNLDGIEKERREMHIDQFLTDGFMEASEWERNSLRQEINNYASQDDWKGLDDLLQGIQSVGLPKAIRKRNYGSTFARLRYLFWVFEGLTELFVAFRAVQIANSEFEKVVICILLYSYARLAERAVTIQVKQAFGDTKTRSQFNWVYRLLKERPSKFWGIDEALAKDYKQLTEANCELVIHSFKFSAIALLSVVDLLWTVL